jgi:hypothetical protein
MIVFLATKAHCYTFQAILKWRIADVKVISYDDLFRAKRLPEATYVFTDMDRLGFWELELAAGAYFSLRAAGFRVLNNPALARQRFSLLKALKAAGLNRFNAWRVEDEEWPDRYPVFIRQQTAHRSLLSDLLANRAELEQAIARQLAWGRPRKDLIIIEYCAEPVREQLFRKWSTYRVGEHIIPTISVHERSWVAKDGEVGLAGRLEYEWEHAAIRDNRFAEPLQKAFEIADIEYGRADFGLVGGTPQIYEINTNPTIAPANKPHPFEIRTISQTLARDNFIEALKSIDSPRRRNTIPNNNLILEQKKHDRCARSRWMP